MFRQIDAALWVLDKPFAMLGLQIGGRMTVCRLQDGSLLVHSPVRTTPEERAALTAIGPVRHIVAPNLMHHLFVADLKSAFPEARVYVAPGLPQKLKTLRYDEVLGDTAPAAWAGQIEQHVVGGMPGLNEVVFFVKASRALMVTDLVFNFTSVNSTWEKLFWTLNGALGGVRVTRVLRSTIKDRAMCKASIERILSWDFDRITLCHGEVVTSAGRDALRQAYGFLLNS